MFKLIFLTTLLCSIISGNIEQGGTDSNESIPIKVERQEKPLRPRTPDYCGDSNGFIMISPCNYPDMKTKDKLWIEK